MLDEDEEVVDLKNTSPPQFFTLNAQWKGGVFVKKIERISLSIFLVFSLNWENMKNFVFIVRVYLQILYLHESPCKI